jgi:hypothetical protein
LISPWIKFWFVTVVPKYLNCDTFSNDLFPIFISPLLERKVAAPVYKTDINCRGDPLRWPTRHVCTNLADKRHSGTVSMQSKSHGVLCCFLFNDNTCSKLDSHFCTCRIPSIISFQMSVPQWADIIWYVHLRKMWKRLVTSSVSCRSRLGSGSAQKSTDVYRYPGLAPLAQRRPSYGRESHQGCPTEHNRGTALYLTLPESNRSIKMSSVLCTLHWSELWAWSAPPLLSSGHSSWLQIQRSRVRFPALPHFLRSSGSGTSAALTTRQPSIHKSWHNFVDKWRSLSRYSSLAD